MRTDIDSVHVLLGIAGLGVIVLIILLAVFFTGGPDPASPREPADTGTENADDVGDGDCFMFEGVCTEPDAVSEDEYIIDATCPVGSVCAVEYGTYCEIDGGTCTAAYEPGTVEENQSLYPSNCRDNTVCFVR